MADNTEIVSLNAEHVAALLRGAYAARLASQHDAATTLVCYTLEALLRGPLVGETVEHDSGMPGLRSVVTADKTATISVAPGLPARFLAAAVAAVLNRGDQSLTIYRDLQDLYQYLTDLSLVTA